MATTIITITVEHGDASLADVSAAAPAILTDLVTGLERVPMDVQRDRGRLPVRDHPIGQVTGFRAHWTAATS